MGNCSIPSSNPVTGRISTPSSNRSKQLNSSVPKVWSFTSLVLLRRSAFSVKCQCGSDRSTFDLPFALAPVNGGASSGEPVADGVAGAPPSIPANVQRSIRSVGRWTLNVVRWALFLSSRRVKGAWWPSRSSKPSSVSNGRGRFDSYPLRLCVASASQPMNLSQIIGKTPMPRCHERR
jgi:hypothetical protein